LAGQRSPAVKVRQTTSRKTSAPAKEMNAPLDEIKFQPANASG
jgi:hypothetical protein